MIKDLKYPIGGEFWFQDKLQNKNVFNDIENQGLLLSGGESAIRFILNKISFKYNEIIALPSYLCPTILKLVINLKIKYKFYNINEKLEIDTESIEKLIKEFKVKAVFFIDYFGFYHNEKSRNFFKSLRTKNILIIEDAVQAFWIKGKDEFIGDYVFNSYRKFLPIDGSLVICRENLNSLKTLNKYLIYKEAKDEYFKLMEKARIKKTNFILKGIGEEDEYLDLFKKANKEYYNRKNVFKINSIHKEYLNYLPENKLLENRNENYNYILKSLKNIREITLLNTKENLESNTPLAIPILIKNRDEIRMTLMKEKIYLPIHWNLKNQCFINNFKASSDISKNILSLPIDWRYEVGDMEFLVYKLKKILSI